MPTREEQRILNELNDRYKRRRNLELVGWIGFTMGLILTSLLFIIVFIPIAQQEALNEQEEGCISTTD